MEALGFNSIHLLAQLISFGVLFLVLKKFLYSKLKKSLEDRREGIRQIAIRNSEVEEKLKELESESMELNKKNQVELRKMIVDAQKNAEEIKKEILEQANIKSKKIIEEAGERIEREKIKASDELKSEAGRLASALAAKILSGSDNSTKLVDLSIGEFEKLTNKKAEK